MAILWDLPHSVEEWKDARAVCRPAPRAIITSSTTETDEKPSSLSPVTHKNLRLSFSIFEFVQNTSVHVLWGKQATYRASSPLCWILGCLRCCQRVRYFHRLFRQCIRMPAISPQPNKRRGAGKRNFKITNFNRVNVLFHHIPPRASAINLRHLRRSGGKGACVVAVAVSSRRYNGERLQEGPPRTDGTRPWSGTKIGGIFSVLFCQWYRMMCGVGLWEGKQLLKWAPVWRLSSLTEPLRRHRLLRWESHVIHLESLPLPSSRPPLSRELSLSPCLSLSVLEKTDLIHRGVRVWQVRTVQLAPAVRWRRYHHYGGKSIHGIQKVAVNSDTMFFFYYYISQLRFFLRKQANIRF